MTTPPIQPNSSTASVDGELDVAITVDVLPAGRGDCVWIECHRPGDRPWRLLIDGGLPPFWPTLRQHLERRLGHLPYDEQVIDLVVISHIDSDHIGGLLPLLTGADSDHFQPKIQIGDIWFNAPPLLPTAAEAKQRSLAQGQRLVETLSAAGHATDLPWNQAFTGGAVTTGQDGAIVDVWPTWFAHFVQVQVTTGQDGAIVDVPFDNGPTITLLSPTDKRLRALDRTWRNYIRDLQRARPDETEHTSDLPLDDLDAVAATKHNPDRSVANAFVSVLGAVLTTLANRHGGPIDVDLFKLSHHGSRGNISNSLIKLVPARRYVVSSNGARFNHPDDEALARIATTGPAGSTIWFNYDTAKNRRWTDPDLQQRWSFTTGFPGDDATELRFDLPERTPP